MLTIRTDLALEAREMLKSNVKSKDEIDGIRTETFTEEGVTITKVRVEKESAAKKLGKGMGTYITLESPRIKNMDPRASKDISLILKNQLNDIIHLKENDNVLIVGLGNWNITPDALGPKVISDIMVTKHLKDYVPEHIDKGLRPVSAISPGVLGITGVETSDIVMGIVQKITPKLVIAIDALASKSPQRISTTIQITDTGISPGSGIGNKRKGLNLETLGVPVIAIGVPTVVDAISIAADMMNKLYENILEQTDEESKVHKVIKELKQTEQSELIKSVIDDEERAMIVTPKEVDNVITHISKVISNGINLALHSDIDLEYIENFTF